MTPDWLNNPDAVANIKRLLIQTGAPLEMRVAKICQARDIFLHMACHSSSQSTGRLLYGDGGATPLREIDQFISFSGDLDNGCNIDITVNCEVLIECKHREGLAVFGFPYPSRPSQVTLPPILGDLVFTTCVKGLDTIKLPLLRSPLCSIGLLDNMHKAPRVYDEQLIYKAGASLYDAIRWLEQERLAQQPHPIITELGLLDAFATDAAHSIFDTWSTARQWMRRKLTIEQYQAFNARYYADDPHRLLSTDLTIYLPLVCVDAPLFRVEVADDGNIATIEPTDALVTGIRIPHWPGRFKSHLFQPTNEARIIIVSVDSLPDILDQLDDWLNDFERKVAYQDCEQFDLRVPLELAFLQSVHHFLGSQAGNGEQGSTQQ